MGLFPIIGIYKITNLLNDKVYIGQSVDIKRRWSNHINYAENKDSKEYNTPIHNAIRKYGKDNFKFEIIEECSLEELDQKEQYWIKFYNATNRNLGYNLTKGGLGGHKSNCKHILQYDFNGNLIKEWSSVWEASESLGIDKNNIRACCLGQKSAGGFQWKYSDDKNKVIGKYQKNTYFKGLELGRKTQPIIARSIKTGEEIKFNRIIDGAKWLIDNNYSKGSLESICSRISTIKNTSKYCCGFNWLT